MVTEALNWDDIRIFLAVWRASSTRKAAVDLGVSRPTVARRLTALEKRLGLLLFERRADGLHATPAATELIGAAEEAERSMLRVERAAHAADHEMRGPIRVSVPAIVASRLLMPDFVAFYERWPQIDLFLSGGYQLSDLALREADVAIRFMPVGVAPDDELTGRKVATAYMAVYGEGDHWIGQRGPKADQSWVRASPFPDLPVRGAIFDGEIQLAALQHGMGRAFLPCFMGEPEYERHSEPVPGMDVWVLVHPDLRHNPRLRVFRDAMLDAFKRLRPRLEGQSP